MVIYFNVISDFFKNRNYVEGFILIKCKMCGAANSLNSSVCAECGAVLRNRRRNTGTDSDNEIFSNTNTEELTRSGEQKIDLFSSGEKYERMRKGAVLEKIYKQEQAMGEVTELEKPPEPEEVKPIIINRESSTDIVKKKKQSSKNRKRKGNGKSSSGDYKIPQRVIEPVDSKLLNQKAKPQTANTSKNENEKNEHKTSASSNNAKNKNKNYSNSQKDTDRPRKQNSQGNGKPKQQKNYSNSEKSADRNENVKNTSGKPRTGENTAVKNKPANNVKKNEAVSDNSQKTVKTENRKPKLKEKPANEQGKIIDSAPKRAAKAAEKAVQGELKAKKNVQKKSAVNASEKPVKAVKESESVNKVKASDNNVKKDTKVQKPKKSPETLKNKPEVKKVQKTETVAAAVKTEKPKNTPKPAVKADNTSQTKAKTLPDSEFTKSDINSNKNLAALSYIGILFLIPLAKSGSSNFCKAHTKQGIAVFIYSLIISLLTLTAVIGLRILLLWKLGLSYTIYNIAAAAIGILMLILLLVPVFSGAVSAFSGVYKSVPIVGKFVKRKNRE